MAISAAEYGRRLKNLQGRLESEKMDAFLVITEKNLRYLLGFDSGRVLVTRDSALCWAKESYWDMIQSKGVELRVYEKDAVSDYVNSEGYKSVGVEDLTSSALDGLREKLKCGLKPTMMVEDMRKTKSRAEIELLEKSAAIAKKGMKKAEDVVGPGVSELEAAAEIEYAIRKAGSMECPFGTGILCCSGPNSRYPHAPLTNRRMRSGDLVVVDLGAVFDFYNSDMTRTFALGRASKEQERLLGVVKNLEEECIARIKVGEPISTLYNFSEEKIKETGNQPSHMLGHGVGLEIHEKPSVGPDEKDVFQEGMVLTIEPGVYTKEFGARFEDTLVVEKRVRRLTV